MSIEVKNLTKHYGTQRAVDHVSFSVKKGEIVGFLGPNGAGKSTTMKMITGFIKPDEGFAQVCGIDVTKQPLAAKKKIGYLPESNALYYDMYVREYLGFMAQVYELKEKKQAIENVIAAVGLTPESHKTISQLSKGYKQRVGIAAALLHDPEVLVLDEPTSGLDPNQIVEIREVIRQQGQSKLVLFSSHILQEVEAICDRIIIINKGKIVADDTLQNLHQRQDATQVEVTFNEKIDDALFQNLEAAQSVQSDDGKTWIIATNNAEDVRKALLGLAVQHNLNIIALQNRSGSLEAIFRQLTQQVNIASD